MSVYFDPRFFQRNIDEGIERQQAQTGVTLSWYLYDAVHSDPGEYGESDTTNSLRWKGPILMPALQVSRVEGQMQDEASGFYTVDMLRAILGYAQAAMAGLMPAVDQLSTNIHLKDRFVFDGLVWTPTNMVAAGLLGGTSQRRSTILITAEQVKPDEMIDDIDFQAFAESSDR